MLALLALPALAGPPRAEVLAGWSGNGGGSYGYATFQPAFWKGEHLKLLARATVSHLHTDTLDAPGFALGPALGLGLGDLFLLAGVNLGARRFGSEMAFETAVTGDVFWRPGQRASLYTQVSVSQALWLRAGAALPVTPRDRPVSLWLGLEGTSSGPPSSLVHEVGPVVEVPVAPLHASLAFRAAVPVSDPLALERTTWGVAAYLAL